MTVYFHLTWPVSVSRARMIPLFAVMMTVSSVTIGEEYDGASISTGFLPLQLAGIGERADLAVLPSLNAK